MQFDAFLWQHGLQELDGGHRSQHEVAARPDLREHCVEQDYRGHHWLPRKMSGERRMIRRYGQLDHDVVVHGRAFASRPSNASRVSLPMELRGSFSTTINGRGTNAPSRRARSS
jgi:hypothetical protein